MCVICKFSDTTILGDKKNSPKRPNCSLGSGVIPPEHSSRSYQVPRGPGIHLFYSLLCVQF